MRYRTTMMDAILTNEKAQEIIDYVSQIYGSSYVGLWMFQAIGTILGQISDISEELMSETNPETANLLLDYWEASYGIPTNTSLTVQQRRANIIAKIQAKGPCSPKRLENAISAALGGATVNVIERTGKNEFTVSIPQQVDSLTPAIAVVERMKPAHLTCVFKVSMEYEASTSSNIAVALTHSEFNSVEVKQS